MYPFVIYNQHHSSVTLKSNKTLRFDALNLFYSQRSQWTSSSMCYWNYQSQMLAPDLRRAAVNEGLSIYTLPTGDVNFRQCTQVSIERWHRESDDVAIAAFDEFDSIRIRGGICNIFSRSWPDSVMDLDIKLRVIANIWVISERIWVAHMRIQKVENSNNCIALQYVELKFGRCYIFTPDYASKLSVTACLFMWSTPSGFRLLALFT